MTTTLVVGGSRDSRTRHACGLLRQHEQVTWVQTRVAGTQDAPDLPAGWRVLPTGDLTHALIAARNPVLVDCLSDWLGGQLDDRDLWDDPVGARGLVDGLLDELVVAAQGLPYDVVLVSEEVDGRAAAPGSPERLTADLLDHVNRRVSAAVQQVHLILAGRVLDLSGSRPVGS